MQIYIHYTRANMSLVNSEPKNYRKTLTVTKTSRLIVINLITSVQENKRELVQKSLFKDTNNMIEVVWAQRNHDEVGNRIYYWRDEQKLQIRSNSFAVSQRLIIYFHKHVNIRVFQQLVTKGGNLKFTINCLYNTVERIKTI